MFLRTDLKARLLAWIMFDRVQVPGTNTTA